MRLETECLRGINGCDVLFYFIVYVQKRDSDSRATICVWSKVCHRGIGRFSLPRNFREILPFHQNGREIFFFPAVHQPNINVDASTIGHYINIDATLMHQC
jgi:hypothetical protein